MTRSHGDLMDDSKNWPAEHGEAVWRTICRLLGSDEGAADCFQETFAQFAGISRRQVVGQPLGLLKRLATARAIDAIRRRANDRRQHKVLHDQHPSDEAEPWQDAVANELAENLRLALGTISPDQASAFCMTQLEGMDRPAAAEAMGITVDHLAVLLHRARANLQQRLAKHQPPVRR
jgi:RNA polymerase sigma-70 factor (ECF subfamily)